MRSTLIACIALAARVAAADSPPPDPPVAPAVPPDQVGGITVDDDRSSAARGVGRVALYPIRLGAQIVLAPLRGGAWLVERYQLRDRIARLFVSDDGTYGIYPTAFAETGLGLNVGVHAFDNDLFGNAERLTLAA